MGVASTELQTPELNRNSLQKLRFCFFCVLVPSQEVLWIQEELKYSESTAREI